jgi:hypothetical protein
MIEALFVIALCGPRLAQAWRRFSPVSRARPVANRWSCINVADPFDRRWDELCVERSRTSELDWLGPKSQPGIERRTE